MIVWRLVTNLGNSALLLPCGLAIALWLCFDGEWPRALRWSVSFGLANLIVLASKIAFIGWGIGIPALDFTGISGHSMLATVTFPVALPLLVGPHRRGALAGAALGMAVTVSRVVLGYHSASEAIAGALLGSGTAAWFLARDPVTRRPTLQVAFLAVCLLAIIACGYGTPAPTEGVITRLALTLSGHTRPFTRGDLMTGA